MYGGAAAALLLGLEPAPASAPWMSEPAMRQAFIGKTLDGHYASGVSWTETYFLDGRLDYREPLRAAGGAWSFRGRVFCTFYDPGEQALAGGCWRALSSGANCYEFYAASPIGDDQWTGDRDEEPATRWSARGWRRGEPATCVVEPSA
jgi:hypothetical protein